MKRNAAATKEKILDAATGEFAAVGFAGARVDRIAERAGYNKQLIYAHFGSKEGLFEAVADRHLADVLDTVPLDPGNLPEYAARLHDYNRAHPEVARLVAWFALEEFPSDAVAQALTASIDQKVARIRQAQAMGVLDTPLAAEVLLQLILALSVAWGAGPHAIGAAQRVPADEQRRSIVEAVRALIAGGSRDAPAR